jgi:hypothetical protein
MSKGSSHLTGALIALAIAAPIGGPTLASAQGGAASLLVHVYTVEGQPLEGASVLVLGTGTRGITDASGAVRLEGVAGGSRTLVAQFLGFAPARSTLVMPLSGSAEVSVSLSPRPIHLAEVQAPIPVRRPLEGTGFYRRQESGIGTFVTRAEIESARPRALSDFLRGRVSGVDLTPAVAGTAHASMRGNVSRNCPIQFYLDGVQTLGLGVDDVKPYDVEGMEIYRGAASIPVAFNKGTAVCGVIAVWTKR